MVDFKFQKFGVMQYISTTSNVKVEKKPSAAARQSILSLYDEPPQEELTLDEFEMFSLDRLQLLRSIDVLKAKNVENESLNRDIYEVCFVAFLGILGHIIDIMTPHLVILIVRKKSPQFQEPRCCSKGYCQVTFFDMAILQHD